MRPHARHWEALRLLPDQLEEAEPPAWKTLPPDSFAREIAPRLLELTVDAIQAATGLSVCCSRRVRFGHHVPHKKHWQALLEMLK
jgi:hypothetical protein